MDALPWIGLTNAVLAGVLAVMAALLGRVFRRWPALVHALWLLVLLKLVTPPLVRPSLPWSTGAPAEETVETIAAQPEAECPVCRLPPEVPAVQPAQQSEVVPEEPGPEADGPAWSWHVPYP